MKNLLRASTTGLAKFSSVNISTFIHSMFTHTFVLSGLEYLLVAGLLVLCWSLLSQHLSSHLHGPLSFLPHWSHMFSCSWGPLTSNETPPIL
jgi:hypothetical protein